MKKYSLCGGRELARVATISALVALVAALFSAPLRSAEVDETFHASLALDSGVCFSGGDYRATETVIAGYGRSAEHFRARGELRHAPTGGDCGLSGLSARFSLERDWPLGESPWYASVGLSGEQTAVSQAYSRDGRFAFLVDGAPVWGGLMGVGRELAPGLRATAWINVAPTDWVGGSERALRAELAYRRPLAGGDLALSAGCLCGAERLAHAEAAWTRGLVRLAWRADSGLTRLASPFPATHPELGWALDANGGPRDRVDTLSIGLSWPAR